MTALTREDLTTLDIDWFAIDPNGLLAHFTSNGTLAVPEPAVRSKEGLDFVYEWMIQLPRSLDSYKICTRAKEYDPYLRRASSKQIASYFEASIEWAERGFFTFNICNYGGAPSTPYFLTAIPHKPLHKREVPAEVVEIIEAIEIRSHVNKTFEIEMPFDPDIE